MLVNVATARQVGCAFLCCLLLVAASSKTKVVFVQQFSEGDSGCTGDATHEAVFPIDACVGFEQYNITGSKIHRKIFSDRRKCTEVLVEDEVPISSCVDEAKISVLEVESDKLLTQYEKVSSSSSCSAVSNPDGVVTAIVQDRCFQNKGWEGKSQMFYCSGGIVHKRAYQSVDCSGTPEVGFQVGGPLAEYDDGLGCTWTQKTVQCSEGGLESGSSTSQAHLQHQFRSCAWIVSAGLVAIGASA